MANFEKPNLWCVAGVPGVGKTTLSEQLVVGGGFEAVETDDCSRELGDEIDILTLNRLRNPELFSNLDEYFAAMKRMAPIYRGQFKQILEIMCYPGFEFEKNSEPALKAMLLIRDDVDLMNLVLSQAQDFMHILNRVTPHFESWRKAIEIAQIREKTVLLVSHNLTSRPLRKRALTYFKSREINPGLVVVKGLRSRLLHTAAQRMVDGIDQHFFHGRANVSLVDGAQDYQPEEGWSRVVIVKRESPDEGIENIRAKLLRQMETTIISPVPFVTSD